MNCEFRKRDKGRRDDNDKNRCAKGGDILRKIIALFLIGLLFGCAHHPQVHWVRANTTKKQLNKDSLACEKEADSLVKEEFGWMVPLGTYRDYYDRCMLGRGYVKQK